MIKIKDFILYLTVTLLLLYIFIQQQCSAQNIDNTTKQEVLIPEKKGSFDKPIAIIHNNKKDSVVYKKQIIYTENPVNKKLYNEFLETKDSLERVKLYLKSIQEKDGTYVYDDNNLKLEVYTKVRGEILKIKPTYTIKERKEVVQVKQKESIFAVYAGASIGNNVSLSDLSVNATLGIQNKKGDIFTCEYGLLDKSYKVGYIKRFINIKK